MSASASVACADLGPSPREDTSAWLSKLEKTIKEKQTEISKLYGAPESKFSDGVKFYDANKNFGFILPLDPPEDKPDEEFFVHASCIKPARRASFHAS